MAYTKKTTNSSKEKAVESQIEVKEGKVAESTQIPDEDYFKKYKEMADMVAAMQEKLVSLTDEINKKNEASQKVEVKDKTEKLLEVLTNRKSDKEVTIVHNREMMGGLSTAIRLTGLSIDFHRLGEERVLSWQQFEECVSKYRRWFEKEIILLAPGNEEIAKRYSVPCLKRQNKNIITQEQLMTLGDYGIDKLENFYKTLSLQDQSFICSYWLGKCYEKDPKYYDRYKIELLNRLSDNKIFDNVLTEMNNDFSRN